MPAKTQTHKRKYAQEELPSQNGWLERIARLNLHFGRYLRDAAGVLLVAFALMCLFTFLGFEGNRSTPGGAARQAVILAATRLPLPLDAVVAAPPFHI